MRAMRGFVRKHVSSAAANTLTAAPDIPCGHGHAGGNRWYSSTPEQTTRRRASPMLSIPNRRPTCLIPLSDTPSAVPPSASVLTRQGRPPAAHRHGHRRDRPTANRLTHPPPPGPTGNPVETPNRPAAQPRVPPNKPHEDHLRALSQPRGGSGLSGMSVASPRKRPPGRVQSLADSRLAARRTRHRGRPNGEHTCIRRGCCWQCRRRDDRARHASAEIAGWRQR